MGLELELALPLEQAMEQELVQVSEQACHVLVVH
jgi:hypothetical protein